MSHLQRSLCVLTLLGFSTPSIAQEMPDKLNAAHILIQYQGSSRANPDVTRSKADALKRAKEIVAKAQLPDADFAALAKEFSDGPSGPDGGNLGNFAPNEMVKPFTQATAALKVGEVSDPVESKFGYHVILRKNVAEDMCAAHILIQYAGSRNADRANPPVTRTKEEALKLGQQVAKLARADGADFVALVKEYSDDGSATGSLGVFSPRRMLKPIATATASLKIGGVSDPVETQFGYHVILRRPLPRKISARHILVQHAGSQSADGKITRTKEEAQARLAECIAKLKAGEKFADLAREYSDGPSGVRGGDLGEFPEGAMVPAFNDAAFALKVNGVSDVVETPFGFHIIYRYK